MPPFKSTHYELRSIPEVNKHQLDLVEAERLDYDDSQGVAAYEDDVRLRFVEGWVDTTFVERTLLS